jgi:hypothetical protein
MKTRGQPFRVRRMNTPPLRSRPGCEGARSAAMRWCCSTPTWLIASSRGSGHRSH